MAKMLMGRVAEARRAISSSATVLDVDERVVAAVIDPSLPTPPDGEPARPPFDPAEIRIDDTLDPEERLQLRRALHFALRKRASAEGRDLAGWSYAMLYRIVNTPGDPHCSGYDALLTVCNAVRGGIFLDPQLEQLRACRGIVITKPGHTSDNISGRMIGIPPTLIRLTIAIDQRNVLRALDPHEKLDCFGALQFAVASEAGAMAPALILQGLIDGGTISEEFSVATPASQPPSARSNPRVLVKFDIKKAFHHLLHSKLTDVVHRKTPQLDYYMRTMYGPRPCPIVFAKADGSWHTREVTRGVLPGDPIGTLMMCLAMHEYVAAPLSEEFREVVGPTFADDINTLAPLGQLVAYVTRLQERLAIIGNELNIDKSEALLVGGTDDDRAHFEATAARLGIKTAQDDGLVIVGVPVGGKAYCKAWASALADKVIAEQKLLANVIHDP